MKSNFKKVSFGECFEGIKVCTVSDVFEEGVREGGNYWEGSVTPDLRCIEMRMVQTFFFICMEKKCAVEVCVTWSVE